MNFEGVSDATVYINRPKDDGTIFSEKQPTSVSAALKVTGKKAMESDKANAIAYYLANAVGNADTKSIVITDTAGNLLFNGKEETDSEVRLILRLNLKRN